MKAKGTFGMTMAGLAICTMGITVQAQTRAIFQRISTNLIGDGYTRVGSPLSGWLDDGESTTRTMWLARGERYVVAAACDRDCSDVDLQLISPGGVVIGSDLDSDDEPVIYATPRRSDTYTIRVSMARCSSEPCEFVAGVFSR